MGTLKIFDSTEISEKTDKTSLLRAVYHKLWNRVYSEPVICF